MVFKNLADSVYRQLEQEWSESQLGNELEQNEVPLTAIAEVDESEDGRGTPDLPSPTHATWETVHWQPRLGEIHEESSAETVVLGDDRSGRYSYEKYDPGRKASGATVSVKDLSSTPDGDNAHTAEDEHDRVSRATSVRRMTIARPAANSRRQSIAGGTTNWAPQSIHYRIRTRSGIGSVSGASMVGSEVEVESITDKKIHVPRPIAAITTFHDQPETPRSAVKVLAAHDDYDRISNWRKRLYALAPFLTFMAMGSYFAYFGYRIFATVQAQRTFHKTYVMAWIFIVSEFLVSIPAFFHNTYALLSAKGRKRAKLRLEGTELPAVDVFITCCKEDVDVILDTARAACAQDYPSSRFRVVVCDDGADPDLRMGVEALTLEHPNLYYHARIKIKGKPHHFKAGNLIAATEMVEQLPGGAGEFIAALDADMIPEADWLRCIIAHMVDDPKMGLVCPPQLFYNVPNNDPLVQSLDAFVHVMEPTKDANGVAWCTGSGYAIRKTALTAIGGWPVGSLAEDVYTSSLLLGNGWKTAFVHEGLQFGTVPDTFTGHLKQRTRWTLGTLQTAMKLNFCLWGPIVKDMTFLQRLSGFVFPVGALFSICLMITLLTIPIVLVSGGTLVAYANAYQLRWQIRLAFISLVLTRMHELCAYLPSGYRLAQRDAAAHMWMTPYHSMTVLRSFLLPSWLGGKPMAFSSSGSIKSELSEREPANRAPLWRRVYVMMWSCECYMHLAFVAFVVTAVVMSCCRAFTSSYDYKWKLIYLLTHAFWPPVLWIICLTAYLTPLIYMIFPPDMPDREELLDRDPKTGVARPKPKWKSQRWRKWSFWHETQWTLCSIYTTVVFAGTFFY